MAKKKSEDNHQLILSELKKGIYRPVYLLMGEETYYTDVISNFIKDNAIDESLRDFNQTILYVKDYKVADFVAEAKRFPMMGDKQVVIVKEAQVALNESNENDIESLKKYLEKPLLSTILVICYMNGTINRKKKINAEIVNAVSQCGGIVSITQKLYDYEVSSWLQRYLTENGLQTDQNTLQILAENIGGNMNRLANEIEKLKLALPQGEKIIKPQLVEDVIGISNEYNNTILCDSILKRNIIRASKIVAQYSKDIKNNPIFPLISILLKAFYNVLIIHYSENKQESVIAERIGVSSTYIAKNYIIASTIYSAKKCMKNIAILRDIDCKAKGINSVASMEDLYKELIFRIMH